MFSIILITSTAVVFASHAEGVCPSSADQCVNRTELDQLSTANITEYCVNGSILVVQALACLEECDLKDSSGYIGNKKTDINRFCAQASSKCSAVVDVYVNQTKCFVPYGGMQMCTKDVLDTCVTALDDKACEKVYWGRSCQRLLSLDCEYNYYLDIYLMSLNRGALLALSCCGSEKVPDLARQAEDNSKCKDVDTRVTTECSVACDIAAASNSEELCRALEKQAACLGKNCAGCANAERRYILPRLDAYAVANKHLSCNISYSGMAVKVAASKTSRPCIYSDVLNSCLLQATVDNALDFTILKSLINGDMPIYNYCKFFNENKASASDILDVCLEAMRKCVVPQSRLLSQSTNYEDKFSAELGTLPLNAWGMKWILNWLNGTCQGKDSWTTPICTITTPKSDGETSTLPANTLKHATPSPRTTPTYKVAAVTRGRNGVGNFGLPSTPKKNTLRPTTKKFQKINSTPKVTVEQG